MIDKLVTSFAEIVQDCILDLGRLRPTLVEQMLRADPVLCVLLKKERVCFDEGRLEDPICATVKYRVLARRIHNAAQCVRILKARQRRAVRLLMGSLRDSFLVACPGADPWQYRLWISRTWMMQTVVDYDSAVEVLVDCVYEFRRTDAVSPPGSA
jgi:hypothetical protein